MIINIFAKQLKDIVGERLHLHFFQNSFGTLHSQNHIITVIVCIPTQNQAHPWEGKPNKITYWVTKNTASKTSQTFQMENKTFECRPRHISSYVIEIIIGKQLSKLLGQRFLGSQ